MQVTPKAGFEVEHFQVDIRLLPSYAISKNRQTDMELLEVLQLAKRDLRIAPEHRKERKKARILSNQ